MSVTASSIAGPGQCTILDVVCVLDCFLGGWVRASVTVAVGSLVWGQFGGWQWEVTEDNKVKISVERAGTRLLDQG